MYHPERPVIVQSDRSILLEVHNDAYESARDALARFAELERSPEHLHTYRLTALSLWNAAAAGLTAQQILDLLAAQSKYALPPNVITDVRDLCARFGQLWLSAGEGGECLVLHAATALLADELEATDELGILLSRRIGRTTFEIPLLARGEIKQRLTHLGHPVDDRAGFAEGAALAVSLRATMRHSGQPFAPRRYQDQAAGTFIGRGGPEGATA